MKILILIFGSILFLLFIVIMFCSIFNCFLPKYFCDKLEWHIKPKSIVYDGVNYKGFCPRCKREIMKDGRGNWV
jgi:hypothetical protein